MHFSNTDESSIFCVTNHSYNSSVHMFTFFFDFDYIPLASHVKLQRTQTSPDVNFQDAFDYSAFPRFSVREITCNCTIQIYNT